MIGVVGLEAIASLGVIVLKTLFVKEGSQAKPDIRHRMCLCKRATGGQRVAGRFLINYESSD
jgi:hypothetical protein